MIKYPCGHDYGNSMSDFTTIIDGKAVSVSMPTIETTVSLEQFRNLSGKDLSPNSVLLQMAGDDTAYMIGEEVLVQRRNGMSHRNNISRYYQMPSVRALIGNACRVISDKRFGLFVTTGVPVATYKKDRGIKDLIKTGLTGTYTCHVTYHNSDGELISDEERIIDIEVTLVVMEGAGVILAHGDGGDVEQAVIDIGGGTCDIYAAKGQHPILDKCQSEKYGVEASIALLKDNFLSVHKRELQQVEAIAMMLAYADGKEYPRISVKGREIKAGQQAFLVEEAVRVIGKQIQSFVSSTLNEGVTSDSVASGVHKVMIIGRGSFFYKKYIREIIGKDQLQLFDDPGTQNSFGYAAWSDKRLIAAVAE